MGERAVVIGFGVTGRAVTRHLVAAGGDVRVVEDRAADSLAGEIEAMGAALGTAADAGAADVVVPSPGVRPGHPALAAARRAGVPVTSEVELAFRAAGGRSIVAVTGTNGKTTVTTMVAAMLVDAGRKAVAAGNIGVPLIEAVLADVDVVVAEVSSFQLAWTSTFRPEVAVWLNLAPDHLDWHADLDDYAAAKARIWANQGGDDVAVVNAGDPVVMAHAAGAPGRVVSFGAGGDYREEEGALVGPGGTVVEVGALARSLPHDVANAAAATAAAEAAGVPRLSCARVLATFGGLPHRVELVGESGGVRWYDDSKATTPAAVEAALAGFDSVVLIAGGRNKGLDLGVLRAQAARLRAVVAVGEASAEVTAAFDGAVPVTTAPSMPAAVAAAARAARPGDAVILSPGCASHDWYRDYAERGAHFSAEVQRLLAR